MLFTGPFLWRIQDIYFLGEEKKNFVHFHTIPRLCNDTDEATASHNPKQNEKQKKKKNEKSYLMKNRNIPTI